MDHSGDHSGEKLTVKNLKVYLEHIEHLRTDGIIHIKSIFSGWKGEFDKIFQSKVTDNSHVHTKLTKLCETLDRKLLEKAAIVVNLMQEPVATFQLTFKNVHVHLPQFRKLEVTDSAKRDILEELRTDPNTIADLDHLYERGDIIFSKLAKEAFGGYANQLNSAEALLHAHLGIANPKSTAFNLEWFNLQSDKQQNIVTVFDGIIDFNGHGDGKITPEQEALEIAKKQELVSIHVTNILAKYMIE